MKKLYIIRHAKSSWEDGSLKDQDRPLNNRGQKDAPMMAEYFHNEVDHVDMLVSSPALRALTTCKIFADQLKYPTNAITIADEIYGASISEMMRLINGWNNDWETVCIFGHNPTFTYLAEQLCDINIGNLPTCGIVGVEFGTDSWDAVSLGSGTQILYDYPKNHK
ncbi:MAG: phosphohistidine phosphatase [Flavobacteriales bacterium]|nr:phosphohistidine phosphatase [Flavobacteriales bacterium]|tara:strand:+ start:781 stop:1275 length:495 start_codon:yes stop_codon:yes gene_type:complete